jgi:hypothetical protein
VTLARLAGLGVVYGFGFMMIKSLFPEPFILLIMQGGGSSEGNLTVLALVYMAVGLIAGLIAAPIFGLVLLARRGAEESRPASSSFRLTLSMGLALSMGFISGLLTLGAYATGILPTGGVLDPLSLIRSSNHPEPGIPLLVAWTIVRDLLPAGLAGLFLSPIGGEQLLRFYEKDRRPIQRTYEWEE